MKRKYRSRNHPNYHLFLFAQAVQLFEHPGEHLEELRYHLRNYYRAIGGIKA